VFVFLCGNIAYKGDTMLEPTICVCGQAVLSEDLDSHEKHELDFERFYCEIFN
jgi:hypothetical protein